MAKGSSGGAKYGIDDMGNSKGMPSGKSGGQLMNGTPPSSGGKAPAPPSGTSAVYGSSSGKGK